MQHAGSRDTRCDADGGDQGLRAGVLGCVWVALVVIGVCGRLWQPGWNVTPMAGIALAAGAFLPGSALAASVPMAALAIGNLALPAYDSLAMAAIVYAATIWPVLLGRLLAHEGGRMGLRWLAVAGSALVSSLVFFVTTNLAHWWFTSDYPHSLAGLVACYTAALPFYRWMPVGDVAWTAAIFAGLSAALAAARSSRAAAAA